MEKLQVKGVEVTFGDLTEEVQRNLYLNDRERFQIDAAGSRYSEIRKLIVSEESMTLELLNKMLRKEVQNKEYHSSKVEQAILDNPKFQMEQETLKVLVESENWEERLIAAKSEDVSSELLNEMLRKEVQNGYNDEDVEQAILDNLKFQMEQETLKVLVESENWGERLIAAESEDASSELLNEMLRKEVQNGYNDEDVEQAILDNPKFQMEQETLKVLVESEDWKDRLIAAKSEEISKELLESMYQKEENDDVLKEIENNLMLRNKISKGNFILNLVQKRKCIQILKEVREGKNKQKTLLKYLQEILDVIG